MKQSLVFSLYGIILLAACAAPVSTPTPVPIEPTATSVPMENTAVPSVSAPTKAATAEANSAQAEVVIYKIVPDESQVSYEVAETFLNDNRFNLAMGVTKQISGEITADKADPTKSSIGPITVDISQFTSDSNRRDSAIRGRWLESEKYPQAVFTPTKIEALPSSYVEGQDYTFKVTGDLKVREVTKPVTFDVTAQLNGDVLSGTAGTTILLSDFGVGPISIGGMLNTEDQAKLNLKFVAKP